MSCALLERVLQSALVESLDPAPAVERLTQPAMTACVCRSALDESDTFLVDGLDYLLCGDAVLYVPDP